ncbi:MAG: hypothetical protein LBQ46_02475 [Treponema sp.]|jgi:biotin transport system permease protein|nr:hypothetical protein [Treponema sp.]
MKAVSSGAKPPPFGYRPGRGPLYRCPALVKLLALLLLSVFAYTSVPGLAIAALGLGGAALIGGIRPWTLLRGGSPLVFLALFFLLLRVIRLEAGALPALDTASLPGALAQSLSMLVSFAAGSLLFTVTTMKELRDALAGRGSRAGPARGLRSCPARLRFRFGLVRFRFGLAFTLMLGFLPRFFEIWETANLAWQARGGRGGMRRMAVLIPLVTELMIETAFNTSEALEARGLEL